MRLTELSKINLRGALLAMTVMAACLVGPSAAVAQKTSIYSQFSSCPTGAPAMNEPANEGAACVSALVREGSIRLGNLGAPISSPLHIQLALVGGQAEGELPPVVPGSTSLQAQPFFFPNPFYVPPTEDSSPAPGKEQSPSSNPGTPNPVQTAKRHKKKKHHRRKHRQRKHRHKCHKGHKRHKCHKGHKGHRGSKHRRVQAFSRAPQRPVLISTGVFIDNDLGSSSVPAPLTATTSPPAQTAAVGGASIEVVVEPVGDIRNVNPSAFVGEPGTAFEFPMKLHLKGAGLGPTCYIGTTSDPIVLAPEAISMPTSFQVASDPNGFQMKVLGVGGENLEDTTFEVPGAIGCGSIDPPSQEGTLDGAINSFIGLPASEGDSKALFGDVLLEMAGAEYDGTPPDGGAEIQAAFEAAK